LSGEEEAIGFGAPGRVDSLGHYRFRGSPGSQELRLYCPTHTAWFAERLATDTSVVITADSTLTVDLAMDVARCSEPAPFSLRVEMRGHYAAGFEMSSFVPCPGSLQGLPGAAHLARSRIWVTIAEDARGLQRARAHEHEQEPNVTPGGPEWHFVRWTGVLSGPGSYGHLGVASYLFRVEALRYFSDESPRGCPSPARSAPD
jgi:hypothetical protein